MTLPVDTVISAGDLVTGAFGGDSLSEHSKLCGREFTADCSMFNTKHDVSLMWLIAASSSLHVCGMRGEMLSGPVADWTSQSCERSAETLALSCSSSLSPHPECLEPSPTYSCSSGILGFGGNTAKLT